MHPAPEAAALPIPPAADGFAAITAFAARLDRAVTAGGPVVPELLAGLCAAAPRWSSSGLLAVERGRTVRLAAQHGNGGDLFDGLPTRWPLATSPAKRVLDSGAPFTTADITAEPDFPLYRMDAALVGYRAVTILPLQRPDTAADEPAPVLMITLHAPQAVAAGPDELGFLEALAGIAGLALAAERRRAPSLPAAPPPSHVTAALAQLGAGWPRLAATAAAFALSGGRYQATADRLGLHVSTVRYRLDRIATRHGLDLSDDATRNAVAAAAALTAKPANE